MKRDRSIRRHYEQRAKKRAEFVLKTIWGAPVTPQSIGHTASTHGKPCSCAMCCNRRAYEGPTLNEIRRRADTDDL